MATFTVSRTGFTNLDNTYNGLPVRVWGTSGTTTEVSVTLSGLSHGWPDDLDLVLIGPGNRNLVFMSDAGGDFTNPINNVTLTFSDRATLPLPDGSQIATGSYRPGAFEGTDDDFEDIIFVFPLNHAATTGTSTFATSFNGVSPNAAWTLGASDDGNGFPGNLSTWSMTVTTSSNEVVLEDPAFSGEGDDVITVTSTGTGSGTYTWNGGNLVTFAGVSKITINGKAGNDTLRGGTGNDILNGDLGNDTLNGSGGNDNVNGGSGNDTLAGGAGDDVLRGGTGHDKLNGSSGNDVLAGDAGKDIIIGGGGKDRFDFNAAFESKPGSANRDKIEDFKRGHGDKIDLSGIDANTKKGGNQKFKFIGDDKFSKTPGELRFKNDLVQADIDGDGKAEFEIRVDVNNLIKSDFIL